MSNETRNAAQRKVEKRELKVTCIGGGTGLSTLLRGLKRITSDVTAIVTVMDDGGGSGVLRDELGMPPPGDIRNCIQALSNAEPTIEMLMSYRFDTGVFKGQSFGNLFLAAINGISESFDKAVIKMGEVLSITGRVLPVTNADVRLVAEFEDGSRIEGESVIAQAKADKRCKIRRIDLLPSNVTALSESIEAIERAEMIILGPGSLYTSIIPNLLVGGVSKAILQSDAIRLYICNVMTQPGETEGYTASEHIKALFTHARGKLFDYCLINDAPAPKWILDKYVKDGALPVREDEDAVRDLGVELIRAPVAFTMRDLARHDSDKLAREILNIFIDKSPTRLYGTSSANRGE